MLTHSSEAMEATRSLRQIFSYVNAGSAFPSNIHEFRQLADLLIKDATAKGQTTRLRPGARKLVSTCLAHAQMAYDRSYTSKHSMSIDILSEKNIGALGESQNYETMSTSCIEGEGSEPGLVSCRFKPPHLARRSKHKVHGHKLSRASNWP